MSIPLSLSTHLEYPPIYGTDKAGRTRIWQATVYKFDNLDKIAGGMSIIQHGLYGGKLQVDTREYKEGKNIGKKNETTPLQQCVAETEKKMKDKIEKEQYSYSKPTPGGTRDTTDSTSDNASGNPTTSCRKIFPMLANKYDPSSTKRSSSKEKQYPCFVQPKLDGLRCVVYQNVATGQIIYQSRTGGYFTTLSHLDSTLRPIFERNPVLVLDGELYTDQIPFEELAGIIKKKKLSETDVERIKEVEYHVYDIVLADMPFSERLQILQNSIPSSHRIESIRIVPTYLVNSISEFREKFGQFVETGYEGIMLRSPSGFYLENYRSNDLLKYKEFFEDEYDIVGFKEGEGRDKGTVIWVCKTPEGREFSVRPKGSIDMRREWFSRAPELVGSKLTVIYQELSEMKVPRFPVGKALRNGY